MDFLGLGVAGEVGAVGGFGTTGLVDVTCEAEDIEAASMHKPSSRASSEPRTPLVSEPAPPHDSLSELGVLLGPELDLGPEDEVAPRRLEAFSERSCPARSSKSFIML